MADIAIEFRWIEKQFGGVRALDQVSLSIVRGEVHALCGENGAGKSTLAKLLAGVHRADAGELVLDGRIVDFRSPADALRAGVAMVHQELALCPDLSIAENLHLGRVPSFAGFVARGRLRERTKRALGELGLELDPDRPLGELSIAERQLVSIAAAIERGAHVLIFDEATSALSEVESARLRERVRELAKRGTTVIWVSHRLAEVIELADHASVLRDGKWVASFDRGRFDESALVQAMIGRSIAKRRLEAAESIESPIVLSVRELSSPGRLDAISFEVRAGEILGVAGLVGAGKTEIAKALYGLDARARGEVELDGVPFALGSVRRALKRGVALVPEDRKRFGLVLDRSVRENWSLGLLERFAKFGFVDQRAESRGAEESLARLATRTASIEDPIARLSGGNQQKVIFSRTLEHDLRVLLLDEPTRGVDIGAKEAIHELVRRVAESGRAVIVFTSDMPELFELSTRILALREGRVVGEVARGEATSDYVLRCIAGVGAV